VSSDAADARGRITPPAPERPGEPDTGLRSPDAASQPAVLLVDDQPSNLLALEAALEPLVSSRGVQLVRASSGEAALRCVLSAEFAVILLDVVMPGLGGMEVARLIKERERTRHLPIIFLTAVERDRRRVTEGYQSGAVDYLTKPVDPDELLAKVTAFVEMHENREREHWRQRRRYADHVEAAIRGSEERYRLAAKATNDAIWDWDLATDRIHWNEAISARFGYAAEDVSADAAWWVARIHPNDRERVLGGIHSVIDDRAGDGHAWSDEYRFLCADGSYAEVLDRGYVLREASSGRALRMIGAMQDVTAERRARRDLEAAWRSAQMARGEAEAAREEAERASRAKSEFLATMSHEFRTPLNAFLGYLQLLDFGLAGPVTDQQRDYFSRLAANANHLLGLVNDVLDVGKLDAGQVAVLREERPVASAIDATLELSGPQAAARQVGVVRGAECGGSVAGDDVPALHYVGDESRVRQILVNLLSNAIRFTNPGGRVTITCETSEHAAPEARLAGGGPWTIVRVSDTGIGIKPEQQAAVFEPFVQAEAGNTRTSGGTGLGLTISRRLARLMGGDLVLEQSVPGAGSKFALWLPATARQGHTSHGAAETPAARSSRALLEVTSHRVHGLAEVGAYLREHVEDVVEAYEVRLRSDPLMARVARDCPRVELEDHALSFISDVVQTLFILEQQSAGPESTLLRDGSAIQRVIAEHHGRQRCRLGWSEFQIRRDYALLGEELEAMVHRRVPEGRGDVNEALGVLGRLLERAEATSARALREALAASASAAPSPADRA